MLFETYGMIVPEPNTCKNYELFYQFYSLNIKQNLITNNLLKEVKSHLPIMNLEIKESINNKLQEIDTILPGIGVKRESTLREEYKISILNDDLYLKEKYFNGNYEEYINYITNIQQVILLYSSFENTISSYLKDKGITNRIFQKKLLKEVCNKVSGFQEKFNNLNDREFIINDFSTLWKYFTFIRNLYTHSSGVIDEEFIRSMENIHSDIQDTIERNFNFIERSLFPDNEKILRNNDFIESDLFIITEIELRFFRNFIIYVWETIYLLSHNLTKEITHQYSASFNLLENQFQFRHVQSPEESEVLSSMPSFYTKKISNFYISDYLCPSCISEPISLYRTLYNPNISLAEITDRKEHETLMMERVFTCPQCRSFFLSKYQEKLSDNNGTNLLNLSDDGYLLILDQFNIKGSAYMPQEDMENIQSHLSFYQLEKILIEAKKNSARLKD